MEKSLEWYLCLLFLSSVLLFVVRRKRLKLKVEVTPTSSLRDRLRCFLPYSKS